MPRNRLQHQFPRSLFRSALDCIQDITLSAAKETITSSCAFRRFSLQPKGSITACQQFQQLAQVLLPHTVAYEVSCCMLQAIALFINNIVCLELHDICKHDNCQEAAQQLINSALYLGTHQLVLQEMPPYMQLVLCRNLPKLNELRTLKLHDTDSMEEEITEIRELLQNSVGTMKELVVFTFEKNCNDAIVKALAQNCSKLEHLDVTFSKDVTDASVEWIGQFSKLKSLNIWGTFITRENAVQLLYSLTLLETYITDHKGGLENSFPDTLQLRKYATSFFTMTKKLTMICPYLNTIMIYALCCDLLPLAALKGLQHISLYRCTFVDIEKYLEVSGSNLISLGLHEVRSVDIKIITFCTKLKKLELICSTYYNHSIEISYDYTIPHFQSLESLSIRSYNEGNMEHFLLGYKNLKYLDLLDIGQPVDKILLKAISLRCLLNLEVINIGLPVFDMSLLEQLLSNCRNLKTISRHTEILLSEDPNGLQRLKSKIKNKDFNFDFDIDVDASMSEDETLD